jgi:hypothetical protein
LLAVVLARLELLVHGVVLLVVELVDLEQLL